MGCTVLTSDACNACYIVAPGGYLAVVLKKQLQVELNPFNEHKLLVFSGQHLATFMLFLSVSYFTFI